MIELRVAQGVGPTGRLLRTLLRDRGVDVTDGTRRAQAVVCYGAGRTDARPTLNAAAGRYNKLTQFQMMRDARVQVPEFTREIPHQGYPMLARRLQHHGGQDIKACLQREDAQLLRRHGHADFFVKFMPITEEFRFWMYRRRHLGAYRKVLRYPEQALRRWRIGRNYANGYAFELVREADIPRAAVEQAALAVDCLGLDFGAVDVINSNGLFYVLEVNTAPGVEGPIRQGLSSLADKIATWERNGYLRRNGEGRRDA